MTNYLPWIEKYRPQNFSEIISNKQNIIILENMLNDNSLPHLLFYGISGTGKTSTITSLAKKLYKNNVNLMVMKLDASDDRGINTVREEIKGFAEKKSMFQKGVKLIILDEADSMTFDAQFALRRIIEKYSDLTRFCLICNYENKIIPALRSRCANFRFNPIEKKEIFSTIQNISYKENLSITIKAIDIITDLSNGDLRKGINFLQSISMKSIYIDENICYESAGLLTENDIELFYSLLINITNNFKDTYNKLNDIIKKNNCSLDIILKELTLKILKDKSLKNKAHILSNLSDLENKITKSIFTDIYISTLISIFIDNN